MPFLFIILSAALLCRFPSWPVWSPRFSKLRLSKRGGGGGGIFGGGAHLPATPSSLTPPLVIDHNTATNSNPITISTVAAGGELTQEPVRCHSCSTSRTSPLLSVQRWLPKSPLAAAAAIRPISSKPPSPHVVPLMPREARHHHHSAPPASCTTSNNMAHPLHESSIMAHSRYSRPLASFCFSFFHFSSLSPSSNSLFVLFFF